jgi:hypothetical protein
LIRHQRENSFHGDTKPTFQSATGRKTSKPIDTGESSQQRTQSKSSAGGSSLRARDILDQHAASSSAIHPKQFPGAVLGYVTPWNSHGYDIAKNFGTKFSLVSPVWLQVTVSNNEDYLVGGAHDVDTNWMVDVRKRGGKIVPRILFER